MGRPRAYADAPPGAQAVYDAAVARNEAAWAVYDVAARDPQADDRAAWRAYYETIDPLGEAAAALAAPKPEPAEVVELGQLTLFDVEKGAAHAA
jgi:hypothetical protein